MNRNKTLYPWALVAIFTILSVILNIVHAPQDFLPRILAAIPPVALFLSFELLMNQVKGIVRRAAAFQSLRDLATTIRQKQAELDELIQAKTEEIEQKQVEIEQLAMQTGHLAMLASFEKKNIGKGTQEWTLLRRLVWQRDEKQCQSCGVDLSDGEFHCHHIKPETIGGKGRPSNLITLCTICHSTLHDEGIHLDEDGNHPGSDGPLTSLQLSQIVRRTKKDEAMENLLDYLAEHPDASLSEMGEAIGRAKSTAGVYVNELQDAGRLHQNGNGWEVRPT
ncbi:MAG TPA: HNH endonuclease [Chloroflexota bacterium]|nr:HNH endonuclease [Chloroflexota bacterium]HUM67513.1 HNH endonuclease [Chloroflexota bacterium]